MTASTPQPYPIDEARRRNAKLRTDAFSGLLRAATANYYARIFPVGAVLIPCRAAALTFKRSMPSRQAVPTPIIADEEYLPSAERARAERLAGGCWHLAFVPVNHLRRLSRPRDDAQVPDPDPVWSTSSPPSSGTSRFATPPQGRPVLLPPSQSGRAPGPAAVGYRDETPDVALRTRSARPLQLANFWQDVSVDLFEEPHLLLEDLKRLRWPEAERFESGLAAWRADALRVERTEEMFREGAPLVYGTASAALELKCTVLRMEILKQRCGN